MKKLFPIIIAALLIALYGCNDNNNPIVDPPGIQQKTGIIVVNEGLFSQNNATLTYYSIEDKSVTQNIYSAANGNTKLGDTANDMKILGSKGYIAVDQSLKIEVIDVNNFSSLGMIDLSTYGEPRKISLVDSTMGFVTVWNSSGDGVVKFNPSTLAVIGILKVGIKPEGIVNSGKYIFTANSGWGADSTVSVIDAAQFTVVKTLTVGINPNSVIANNSTIYVVSTGSFGGSGLGGIYKIDPVGLTVTASNSLPGNPGSAAAVANSIMILNSSGVIKINSNNLSITDSTFIKGSAVNHIYSIVYSIAFDKTGNLLYLGNPKDFQQNGDIAVYDLSGNELSRFDCGINPGTIVVKK